MPSFNMFISNSGGRKNLLLLINSRFVYFSIFACVKSAIMKITRSLSEMFKCLKCSIYNRKVTDVSDTRQN